MLYFTSLGQSVFLDLLNCPMCNSWGKKKHYLSLAVDYRTYLLRKFHPNLASPPGDVDGAQARGTVCYTRVLRVLMYRARVVSFRTTAREQLQ